MFRVSPNEVANRVREANIQEFLEILTELVTDMDTLVYSDKEVFSIKQNGSIYIKIIVPAKVDHTELEISKIRQEILNAGWTFVTCTKQTVNDNTYWVEVVFGYMPR